MKLLRLAFALFIIGGLMAVPVSCVMDSVEQAREEREFRARYGSQVEQMNRAIQELNRLQARAKWEREQMERIKKEMPR